MGVSIISPTVERETSKCMLELSPVDVSRAGKNSFPPSTSFECRAAGLLAHRFVEKYSRLRVDSSFLAVCVPHGKIHPDPWSATSHRQNGLVAMTASRDLRLYVLPGSHHRKVISESSDRQYQWAVLESPMAPVVEVMRQGDVLLCHPKLVLGFPGTIQCNPLSGNTLAVFMGFTIGSERESHSAKVSVGRSFFEPIVVEFQRQYN